MTDLSTDWLTAHNGTFRDAAVQHRKNKGVAARTLGAYLTANPDAMADAKTEHARAAAVVAARSDNEKVGCVITKERHDLLKAALQHAGVTP